MRASDGILRLSAPSAALSQLEHRRPAPVSRTGRTWLARLLPRRRQPSTYHRCLAIHIHFAGPRSALS
jgi:hypothetical protein